MVPLSEFTDWQAYFHRRKAETEKIDWCFASVCQAVAASQGAKTKIEDFLIRFEEPKTPEEKAEQSYSSWLGIFGDTLEIR
jgi:hypothetical protein